MAIGWRRAAVLAVVTALVTGCPVKPSPDGHLTAQESELDFGEVLIGTNSGIGSLSWDNIDGPAVRTTACEIFAADANTAFAFAKPFVPGPIPKGVSTGALISFTPAKEASYTASATPVGVGPNNKPIAADSVQLTGKGVHRVSAAPLSVESAYFIDHQPLDFHKVVVGQHAYHTLSVRNNGNAVAVARVDWSQSPSAFTASMSSGGPAVQNISINANDVITLIITFSPTAVQVYNDALMISGAPNAIAGTTVTGEGVKPAE